MYSVALFTPPLTQLNTPYPATAYLKGFLESKGYSTYQADIGIDWILSIFSSKGLDEVFEEIEANTYDLSDAQRFMLLHKKTYVHTIDAVIAFLQGKNPTLIHRINSRNYLPEGPRFDTLQELDWYFGSNGIQDKARYLATLYLEDLGDLITSTIGPHFGFSKYAERLARTATSFSPLQKALEEPVGWLDQKLLDGFARHMESIDVPVVGFSIPFPGNVYGALRLGQWLKKHKPAIKIVWGGGYINTELRDLTDPRVFDYVDYILFDDGEITLQTLLEQLKNPTPKPVLKRAKYRQDGKVHYQDTPLAHDIPAKALPAPNYEGLPLAKYLSVVDVPNPMHRLWSEGRWNKLTVAHGCYWKKCSFCDVSLDYIQRFDATSAAHLVDKIELLMRQTGQTGFHFVDEAAPPLALRDMALEILRRKLQISWWANIRFEKTFTLDLCQLLAASGCIAVTGGLEVASDRLLEKMEKGVTVAQVAQVAHHFSQSGVMVHAYLMYGFPTQTAQETIDSLEYVRQMFELGILHSAYWHQFALTVHSPIGKAPSDYKIKITGPTFEGFANNDLFHEDPTGTHHDAFGPGLHKAIYNYMHGQGFEWPLKTFFDIKIPSTTIPKNRIASFIEQQPEPIQPSETSWISLYPTIVALPKGGLSVPLPQGIQNHKLPKPVASFFVQNHHRLLVTETLGWDEKGLISELSKEMNMAENEIKKTEWWTVLKNEIFLTIKR